MYVHINIHRKAPQDRARHTVVCTYAHVLHHVDEKPQFVIVEKHKTPLRVPDAAVCVRMYVYMYVLVCIW